MAARTRSTAPKAEVATVESLLPDLAPTSSDDFQVDARDIQPPRIKAASPTTGAATDGLVPLFSLFSQKGPDDESPQVLVEPTKGDHPDLEKNPDYGVLVHVLRMYKNLSASVDPSDWSVKLDQKDGGEFRTWMFGDPAAPSFARTQYNYVLYVPDSEDADMPHNLLLANTSTGTARQINTLLAKRLNDGLPIYTTAFRLHPEKRSREVSGQTQRWAVVRAREVEATVENVKAAEHLVGMISAARQERGAAPGNTAVEQASDTAPAI